jgi:putative FmdB family regulatory protein
MPIYEYRCTRCGHVLEVMQKLSDPPPNPCPSCQAAEPLERLVSRTSFQLKGGGWYSDLYGSVKKDAKPEAGAPAAKPADAAAKPAPAAAGGATTGGSGSSTGGSASGGGTSGGGSSSGGSSSGGTSGGGSSGGTGSAGGGASGGSTP